MLRLRALTACADLCVRLTHSLVRASLAVGAIDTPLLVVHAEDDPVIQAVDLPLAQLRANARILLVLTHSGGHLGWAGAATPLGPSWVDALATRFLEHHCDGKREAPPFVPPPRARM